MTYSQLFSSKTAPYLFLAPMEGVADRSFRKAISTIGGFDEAVTEFLSVPANAHVESLSRHYEANELSSIPLAAQIMGVNPSLMAKMAQALEKRGAPRIDINCGCPSNTVTGRGAGSSLLKTPSLLHEIAHTVVQSVNIPVTIKMRSGYEDLSLFEENLYAAQESGIEFLTLHPRTKVDGYTPPARWELIARAKEILDIPVVGNGDVTSVPTLLRLLQETHCDAVMIGRGALKNPFLFQEIKAYFTNSPYSPSFAQLQDYIEIFLSSFSSTTPEKTKISKLKQLFSFLFSYHPLLLEEKQQILRMNPLHAPAFLSEVFPILQKHFQKVFCSEKFQ